MVLVSLAQFLLRRSAQLFTTEYMCVYCLEQISIILSTIDGVKSQRSKKLQKKMKIYYKTTSLCIKDNDLFRLRFYTITQQNSH